MNAMILPIFILWKGVLEIYNLSFILDCTYNMNVIKLNYDENIGT